MSSTLLKLCHKILLEYFGDIVADTGEILMKNGTNSFKYLCSKSKHPRSKIQEALCVLIKHNLVIWEETTPGCPVYLIFSDRILLILRFPRYIYLVRELYGEEAEMVVDILAKEGQVTASQIIICACLKLLDAAEQGSEIKSIEDRHIVVRNAFANLVETHFIQRCPVPEENKPIPHMTSDEQDLYRFNYDSVDLKLLQKEIMERKLQGDQNGNGVCQASKITGAHPDSEILWRLNYDRFHLDLRDIEIRNSLSCRIDPLAGACLGAILKVAYTKSDPWAPYLNTVLISEIKDQQKDLSYMDQYLRILVESGGGCLRKIGDAGGGEYTVNIKSIIETITLSHIDNIVQERYGSKAARVFRLVRTKGMMEQDHIAELSMIGKKEAYTITHSLMSDNFLILHEVRKVLAHNPTNKSTYLFNVDTNAVVRMLLEWSYKGMYNLLVQREMRQNQYRRLLERKTRVETIVENLKQSGGTEEQVQEVEEIFSPSERELVNKVLGVQDKLLESELAIDEAIFIFQMFLYYELNKK